MYRTPDERYVSDPIWPCIFINQSKSEFTIVVVYFDQIDLIDTWRAPYSQYLKKEFKIKNHELLPTNSQSFPDVNTNINP